MTQEARSGPAVYQLPVVPQAVTLRAALAHSLIGGRAVTEFEPWGKVAAELRRVWRWMEGALRPDEPL